jgi:putative ABC transport system permease protein
VIIVSALMLATGLVVLVGGLGLSTTLMLNVLERTREIGVQSAIGASPRTIAGHVVFEGVLMGVMSWCVAIVLALPVTAVLDEVAGRIFIKTPLDFFMSPRAAAMWLLLVVVLAALSSFQPARRAARLTVREALAYG